MIEGTIPFHQAEKSLQTLQRMTRATATTAANPAHPHRGQRPTEVTEFLEDDVRLANTKCNRFVFTVVSRLGGPLPTPESESEPIATFPVELGSDSDHDRVTSS